MKLQADIYTIIDNLYYSKEYSYYKIQNLLSLFLIVI